MRKPIKLITTLLLSLGVLAACNTADDKTSYSNIAVTSVELDETLKVLEVGESFQLTATITYKDGEEKAVETQWRSSNSRVAEVTQEGLVTALSSGSATISYIAGYKIATCSIIVPGAGEGGSSSSGGGSVVPPGTDTSGDPTSSSGGSDTSVVPPDPEDEDEDDGKECTVYFFIDYNNIDEKDTTGTKLLAKFKWYGSRPLSESGQVPANPTVSMDPAFPNFIGWSNHTVIDSKADLWDINTDVIGNGYYFYLYGVWSDVTAGEFTK